MRQKRKERKKKRGRSLLHRGSSQRGRRREKKRVAREKKVVVLELFLSSYPSSTSEKSGRTIRVTATSVILFFSSSSHFTRARSPYPPSLSLSRYRSSLRPFFLSRWRSLRVSGIRATILRNGSYFLTACQCFRSRSRCWYSQPVHVTVVGFLPLLRRRMINYCGRPLIP